MRKIEDSHGRSVAYFDPKKPFYQVKLSGPPVGPAVGPSALRDGVFMLDFRWFESEQARWETYKQSHGDPLSVVQSKKETVKDQPKKSTVQEQPKNDKIQHPQPSAPYTTYEKQWLKVHYGNEYHFLQVYGLSIFKDEDREKGRAMVRQFMAEEGPEGKELVLALSKEDAEAADDSKDEPEEKEEDLEGRRTWKEGWLIVSSMKSLYAGSKIIMLLRSTSCIHWDSRSTIPMTATGHRLLHMQ